MVRPDDCQLAWNVNFGPAQLASLQTKQQSSQHGALSSRVISGSIELGILCTCTFWLIPLCRTLKGGHAPSNYGDTRATLAEWNLNGRWGFTILGPLDHFRGEWGVIVTWQAKYCTHLACLGCICLKNWRWIVRSHIQVFITEGQTMNFKWTSKKATIAYCCANKALYGRS